MPHEDFVVWEKYFQLVPEGEEAAFRVRADRAFATMHSLAEHKRGMRVTDFMFDAEQTTTKASAKAKAKPTATTKEQGKAQWARLSAGLRDHMQAKG